MGNTPCMTQRPQQLYNFKPPSDRYWKTMKGQMLWLLRDQQWHDQQEMWDVTSHRFGGTLGALRKDGWQIETQSLGDGKFRYRLLGLKPGPKLAQRKRLYLSRAATKKLAQGVVTTEAIQVARSVL